MRALPSAALLVWISGVLCAQVSVTGRVADENGTAVAGARLEFRDASRPEPFTTLSDVQGRFRLDLNRAGAYGLRAERTGFFVVTKADLDLNDGPNEVNITLNHLQELTEAIDVVYSPAAIDPATTSDERQLNNMEVLAVPYPASQDVRLALPLFAGVLQDTSGLLHFNGGSSDQAGYALNGFNIADPVTGLFETRVSIDAVRSMNLESGRFSAADGHGSAGSVDLETGMGDDRFRFGVTNFIPSVSTQRGLILSKWTPRLTVSGPIARSRAWFHNGFDAFYDVNTIPELPRGQDRSRDLTTSNLTRLQVNLSPSNILTGSYLINYQDSDNQGLSFLNPVETTIDRRRSLNMATVKDQIYFPGGTLIEVGFAASRGVLRELPRGSKPFVISPFGYSGNYFVDLARNTDRQQWLADAYLPPVKGRGTHRFRIGADLERSGFDELVSRHDYRILRADGTLARSVTFTGDGQLRRRNFETALYLQDSWTVHEGLVLELGVRSDWDQIVRDHLVSPRLAAAWSPSILKGTKIAAGFGIYDDPLNLDLLTRHQDQSSLTTFFDRNGVQQGPPLLTRFLVDDQSLAAPRARIASLSVERRLLGFYGKVSYLRREGEKGLVFAEPSLGLNQNPLYYTLRNQRSNRYDGLEFGLHRNFGGKYEWHGSYTFSRARSNAVLDYSLENPVFGRQGGGPLPWDAPHRFLTWGWAPVPAGHGPAFVRSILREVTASYLVETRSGFPFNVVNEENFLVGPPDRLRLPYYFNINLHFEKKFTLLHYVWAWRFGLNNLTNHGNPNVVNNNIDSPFYLTYGRGQQRAFNVRLRFLGRR